MTVTKLKNGRLSEHVVDHIAKCISSGEYKSGEKLPSERDLASTLGVSRPMVRESYRTLEALGVVEVRHGVGALVAENSGLTVDIARQLWDHAAEVIEVLEVRAVLAERCGELAAERITAEEICSLERILISQKQAIDAANLKELADIDRAFHDLICRAARNRVLQAMEEYSREFLGDHHLLPLAFRQRRLASYTEHCLVVSALKDHDPRAAAAAMRLHVLRSNTRIQLSLEERAGSSPVTYRDSGEMGMVGMRS